MAKNNKSPQELLEQYNLQFDTYSDEEIIETFNKQVGNPGWGIARSSYLGAIRAQLIKRNIDFSVVGDDSRMSYAKKVILNGKKIKLASDN